MKEITGKISQTVLSVQAFFNWQGKLVPSVVAWAGLLLLALFHGWIPWRLLFFWIFRVALVVVWFAATIVVPILRIFPNATIKARRLTKKTFCLGKI